MADVSRAGLPSSSSKHVYDGVFGSSKVKSSRLSSFSGDDYGEIFGCSKSDNGGWQSSCCSIPVVELPVSEQRVRGVRGIGMDYGGVFGSFSDEGLSLMNGEELFDQLKKKARTSPPLVSVPSARNQEQIKEVTGSRIPSNCQNVQPSMDGISKLSDGVKHYTEKTNDMPSDESNDTKHVGHFHCTSGPTSTSHEDALLQEVQNCRTSVVKADSQFENDMPIRETLSRDSRSDLRLNEQKTEDDVLIELNSAATSNDTHQFTDLMNGASHDVDSSHKAVISETPVIQADTDFEVDINLATERKDSRHSSPDIGVNEHKSELDASFQKDNVLSGPNSAATLCTGQPCTVSDEADVKFDVKDNFGVDGLSNSGPTKQNGETRSASYQESGLSSSSSAAFDSGKKLRRHSRMTSLDFGRQAYDHDAGVFHRKSRVGSSYSFDASHDPSAAHIKVQPSKVIPSSSQPHFFPIESHYKISENSKSSSPLPSLDDQLDVNSLAAISASALQRAIEEAEMQIRLAKEFLEQEGQGCNKLRFKDTLKTKFMKENKHVNKINNVKKKSMVEDCSRVDGVTITSPFGRDSVLETAWFVPVDEDRRQFLKESIKGENAKAPESIEEGGKNEAEEWEATKHLNQLITGVKNRLASFMTWQVETEKKEESKEVESIIKQPHSSDGGCELKETVANESVIATANKKEIEENVTGVVPSHIEREESKSTESNASGQEKVGGMVDSALDTERSTRTNFLFSFNSGRFQGLPHAKETEKKESQGSAEIETKNRQNQLVDMVMNEQIQRKGNEVNVEVQDYSVSQDSGERLINSIYEECIATIKQHYPMEAHDTNEFTHEEGNDSEVSQEMKVPGKEGYADECYVDERHQNDHVIYEEHGVDGIESTDEEEGADRRLIEESEYDRSASIPEVVNDTMVNEECESDADASIHEANDFSRANEECGHDTYSSFHEVYNATRVNDKYTPIDEEGYDRTVCEEHGDDRSRSADNAENRKLSEEHGEEPMNNVRLPEDIALIVEDDNDQDEIEVFEESEDQPGNQLPEKIARASEERSNIPVNGRYQCTTYHIEQVSGEMNELDEDHGYQSQADHVEETTKKKVEQASCMEVNKCWQMEDIVLSKADEAACRIDGSDVGAETEFAVEDEKIMEKNDFPSDVEMGVKISAPFDEETKEKMEITNRPSEHKIVTDHLILSHTSTDCIEENRGLAPAFTEYAMEFDGIECHNDIDAECENPVLSECEIDVNSGPKDVADGEKTENTLELDEIEHHNNIDSAFPGEDSVPLGCVTDVNSGQNGVIDGNETELKSEDIFANRTIHLHDSGKTLYMGVAAAVSDQEAEKDNVEAVHRRRRWFESRETVGAVERPIIREGSVTNLVVDQDVLEETDLAGSGEIHVGKVDSEAAGVTIRQADTVLNQGDGLTNVETTHKRRRWFVKRGEEGLPQPPCLFAGINVAPELDHEVVNGSMPHYKSDECLTKSNSEADEVFGGEKDKQNVEATSRRKRWFESVENVDPAKNLSNEDDRTDEEVNQEHEEGSGTEKQQNPNEIPTAEEMNDVPNKVEPVNESHRDMEAENRRKKEKENERLAVERAIREVRERAFAEAKERARRDATERPNRLTSQKSGSGDQDRLGKVPSEASSSSDKASMEMQIRAERAAVERATAEVRERALQKALSEKASRRLRDQLGRHPPERSSSLDPKNSSSSHSRSSDPSNNGDKFDGADGESAQRRKARLERQNRTMERAARALEEKNKRDLLVQKEQVARNMLADTLDAEVKRWSAGKEGNVRALLSTLQYILGSDSGWQAVSLTDLVAPTAVRKAYKKANLCVHPDKLQQRGATIQQKYICEKIFDLLKDAWSRFNPDER